MNKKVIITHADCQAPPIPSALYNAEVKKLNAQITSWQNKFIENARALQATEVQVPTALGAFPAKDQAWHEHYRNALGATLDFDFSGETLADFMRSCADPDWRKEIYELNQNPRLPKGKCNRHVAQKLVNCRKQKAQALGFGSYLDYSAANKFITGVAAIKEFLAQTRQHLTAVYQQNHKLLAQYAQKRLGIKKIHPADTYYVLNHLATAPSPATKNVFENYFPESRVTKQLISYVEKLFSLAFIPIKSRSSGTHYKVYDLYTNKPLGTVALDLWAAAEKSVDFKGVVDLKYQTARGIQKKLKLPEIKITCDFQETPAGNRELDFGDLVTLFHEMGHLVETLFTIRNEQETGCTLRENDTIEFYSMFMENFVYDENFMRTLSSLPGSGQKIPRAQYREARRMHKFTDSFNRMEVLDRSLKEIEFYAPETVSLQECEENLQKQLYQGKEIFNNNVYYDEASHIFVYQPEFEHYAGNYYTYLLSEVLAKEIFKKFKSRNPKLVPQKDRELREKIYTQRGLVPFFWASCAYLNKTQLTLDISTGYQVEAPTQLEALLPGCLPEQKRARRD